jgi:YidC/Oxa1 family membrane protein insertase
MKKNDFITVAVLVVLMFGWMHFYPKIEQKFFPKPPVEKQTVPLAAEPESSGAQEPAISAAPAAVQEAAAVVTEPVVKLPSVPEQRVVLSNDVVELTVSSYGGAVVSATLNNYPAENHKNSGPVVLDFEAAPALRYDGIPVTAGSLAKTDDGLV